MNAIYREKQRELRNHRLLAIWLLGAFITVLGFRDLMAIPADTLESATGMLAPEGIVMIGFLFTIGGSSLVCELEREALKQPDKAAEVITSHEVFTTEFGYDHVRLVPPDDVA